jgi:hypothetical protein
MKTIEGKRRSICCACGKRLSEKTSEGEIKWKPSHVGDKGLYCEPCFKLTVKDKAKRKPHS